MKFTLHLTAADMHHYMNYLMLRNRGVRIIFMVFIISSVINLLVVRDMSNFITWLFTFSIVGTFYVLLRHWTVKRAIQRAFEEDRYEVTLTDESLAYHNPKVDIRYDWSKISKIGESKHAYYLYMNKQPALIFPKHCFSSPEEEKQVVDFIRLKLGRA